MARVTSTPRHLDDPIKPVAGMTVLQTFGALLAALFGGGIIFATNFLGTDLFGMPLFLMLRVSLAGVVGAVIFFGTYMLSAERVEPLLHQLIRYARRPHFYKPRFKQ